MDDITFQAASIPLHAHVSCDACNAATALVWYWLPSNNETLAFCGHHATSHDIALAVQGYEVIKDYRETTADELRRRLLEPSPSLFEILALDGMKVSFSSR